MQVTKKDLIFECAKAISMQEAARNLGLTFSTFRRYAKRAGCYKPNMGLKGGQRRRPSAVAYPLSDILLGLYPNYSTYKLKNRLLAEGLKEYRCEICGLFEWLGKYIALELHHLNGKRDDHRFKNLQLICPNCHSQTSTFRAKNKPK